MLLLSFIRHLLEWFFISEIEMKLYIFWYDGLLKRNCNFFNFSENIIMIVIIELHLDRYNSANKSHISIGDTLNCRDFTHTKILTQTLYNNIINIWWYNFYWWTFKLEIIIENRIKFELILIETLFSFDIILDKNWFWVYFVNIHV